MAHWTYTEESLPILTRHGRSGQPMQLPPARSPAEATLMSLKTYGYRYRAR